LKESQRVGRGGKDRAEGTMKDMNLGIWRQGGETRVLLEQEQKKYKEQIHPGKKAILY